MGRATRGMSERWRVACKSLLSRANKSVSSSGVSLGVSSSSLVLSSPSATAGPNGAFRSQPSPPVPDEVELVLDVMVVLEPSPLDPELSPTVAASFSSLASPHAASKSTDATARARRVFDVPKTSRDKSMLEPSTSGYDDVE